VVAPWRPQERTRPRLDATLALLAEYEHHLPVTLRQLFYLLVARQIVAKTEANYRQVGDMLVRAGRAGVVPWSAIRDDRDDLPYSLLGDGPDGVFAALRRAVRYFEVDPQLGQLRRRLLVSEHAGLSPQLRAVCDPFGVPVIASGGFDSVTAKQGLAELMAEAGEAFEVLHVGDLDDAGEDIYSALSEDVAAFAERLGIDVTFARLAVTPEQVTLYALPTAVAIDPKRVEHVVQVEALPPDVLTGIIEAALRERLDLELVAEAGRLSEQVRVGAEARLRPPGCGHEPEN
jgi:hypothetical protein